MEALPAQHQCAPMKRAAVYSVSRGSFRLCETTDKSRWRLPATRLVTAQGSGLRCVPRVLCLDAVRHEGFDNGLVSEGDRLHVTHGLIGRVQAHRDELVHGGNDGVLDFDGVVQLFLALRRDTVVLKLGIGQLLTRGECLEELGRGLVDFLSDGQRPVDTLTSRQACLQRLGDLDCVVYRLYQNGVFVALDGAASVYFSLRLSREGQISWHGHRFFSLNPAVS